MLIRLDSAGVGVWDPAVRTGEWEIGGPDFPKVMGNDGGTHTQYRANGITILSGDFFATTPALVGPVDGLYDRAALIALPEPMRKDYVRHLRTLLPAGAPGLVITVEYEQTLMNGPPFSVPEAELRTHYAGRPVERLADVAGVGPRFEKVGAREKCFSVRC